MADRTKPNESAPEKSLDSHHETLYGTPMNPQTGLVSILKKLLDDVEPIIGFWKGTKWPRTILAGGLTAASIGGVVNLIRIAVRLLFQDGQ